MLTILSSLAQDDSRKLSENMKVMRGNDLLMGGPDIMVQDSLTGNVLMKVFSAYSTGGNYEKPVTYSIPGVEVMQLEEAVQSLWEVNIYAECGMGCTGPIVLIAPEDREKALATLTKNELLLIY